MKTFLEYVDEKTSCIQENINEMSTIVLDKKNLMLIQVNPDRGRQGLEYFKIYNSFSESKADKIARISFKEPKYVIHHNNHGKNLWTLNTKEKKSLMLLLQKKSDMLDTEGNILTNWEKSIVQFNLEKGLPKEDTEENFVSNQKFPKYLPIDLPMPDYEKLQ